MNPLRALRTLDQAIDARLAFRGGGCVKGILFFFLLLVLVFAALFAYMAFRHWLHPGSVRLFGGS